MSDDLRQPPKLIIGDLVVDTGAVRVSRSGEAIALPRLSYRLLVCLAHNAPNVVAIDDLISAVWGDVVVSPETITQRVKLLREALGDDSANPAIIETVRGHGYRLIPNVKESESGAQKASYSTPLRWGAAAVLIAVALAAWFANMTDQSPGASPASIAILPFVNISGDTNQEHFADGLSAELTALLSSISELNVAAHTSALAFKESNEVIGTIAASLNVDYVVEGNIRVAGDELRVAVQLVDARDGFSLWSEIYERRLDNIFAVQDDIASAVVGAISPHLVAELQPATKTDPAAYSHYLRGRYLDNQKGPQNWAGAVDAYKHALEIDPTFAPAWAGLALTYFYQSSSRLLDRNAGPELAREAVLMAIDIDGGLAEAWAALGQLRIVFDGDVTGAIESIEKALQLEPKNSEVLNRAGQVAAVLGDTETAIQYYERAISRDPLNMSPQNALALSYMAVGDLDKSASVLEGLIALNPAYPWAHVNLARVRLLQGKPDVALKMLKLSTPKHWHDTITIQAYHSLDDAERVDRLLTKFVSSYTDTGPLLLAEVYAWLGDHNLAFASLDRAIASRDPGLMFAKANPFLASLHGSPRWSEFLNRIGLLNPTELSPPSSFD